MTEIVIRVVLDPAQTTPEERELMLRQLEFDVDGAVGQFFPTMGRAGRKQIDWELRSEILEDEFVDVHSDITSDFPKGAMVALSRAGEKHLKIREGLTGEVVGYSRDRTLVRVLWDGNKLPTAVLTTFIRRSY